MENRQETLRKEEIEWILGTLKKHQDYKLREVSFRELKSQLNRLLSMLKSITCSSAKKAS